MALAQAIRERLVAGCGPTTMAAEGGFDIEPDYVSAVCGRLV